jgi:hypothetical protein
MGGVVDALAGAGKEALESSGVKDFIEQGFRKVIGMDHEFNRSPAGKDLKNLTMNYLQNKSQVLQRLVDSNSALPKEAQTAPHIIHRQANNIARENIFGKNDAIGAFLLKQAQKSPGMDESAAYLHTQNLADFTSSILQDTETRLEWRKATAVEKMEAIRNEAPLPKGMIVNKSTVSSFKRNASKNVKNPVGTDKWKLNIDPTYVPPPDWERSFMNYGQRVIYPFVAIPHIGTTLNLALSTPMKDLAKTAVDIIKQGEGNEVKQLQDFIHQTGIHASTSYSIYAANYYGSRGLLSKLANDDVGKFIYKSTHNPGFDPMRKWQVSIAGSTGINVAKDMATKLFESGGTNRRAIYELERMGISKADVMMQKGQLNPDQLSKAVYRFVDSKVFLNTSMQRSYLARSNPYFRIGLMYHSYVTRQGRLIAESIAKPFITRDPILLAQTVAVLGVAFPLVGLLTKNVTMITRGDWDDVHWGQDFNDIAGRNGTKAFASQMAEDYAHTAAFGIATSFMRGSGRYALSTALTGPVGNIVGGTLYDFGHPLYRGWEGKNMDFKPLLRDGIEYNPMAVDNIGKLAAHEFLPTKREEELRHPKPQMKFKTKQKKVHFKKFGS